MPAFRTYSRRGVMLSAAAALTLSGGRSPNASNPPRIGFMAGLGYPELDEAFTDELRRQGVVEGRDVVVERRFARANSNDNATMGRELAKRDLVLVVVSALPAALVVREANPRMPMVIGTCPGMVANGFAKTLQRPGGIYTGIDELPPGITRRRMTLLKTAADIKRLALLSTAPGKVAHELQLADALPAAAELGIDARPYRATNLDELRAALASMRADGMDSLQNFQGGLSLANRQLIVEYAASHRMPAIYQARLFIGAGGLMAWAPDQSEQLRIAARMTARILAGTRPGDIPAVYPPKYSLMLNVAAARGIGVTFPAELLGQADETVGAG